MRITVRWPDGNGGLITTREMWRTLAPWQHFSMGFVIGFASAVLLIAWLYDLTATRR